jgi:hypothetical protein
MSDNTGRDLFGLIVQLQSSAPFRKAKVEALLGSHFHLKSENEYFTFWTGHPIRLGDGSQLGELDLRLSKLEAKKGFLAFQVTGRCVSPAELRERYPDLELTDVPRGRSHDEETSFSVVSGGVRLGFGFKERNPDCLSSVVLDPL